MTALPGRRPSAPTGTFWSPYMVTLPTEATSAPEAPVADEAAADPQPEVAALPDTAAAVDAGTTAIRTIQLRKVR